QLGSDPKNQSLLAQLNSATTEYDQISASMGGDRAPKIGATEGSAQTVSPNSPSGNALGVVPTAPTGCTVTTTQTTNNTPVAIPTGPAVVSSTISVVGAGTYLWDLNMQTFITHTFAADLDITLQSPAGTIVTITTYKGAGDRDDFHGAVADDQGEPGGAVPFD